MAGEGGAGGNEGAATYLLAISRAAATDACGFDNEIEDEVVVEADEEEEEAEEEEDEDEEKSSVDAMPRTLLSCNSEAFVDLLSCIIIAARDCEVRPMLS